MFLGMQSTYYTKKKSAKPMQKTSTLQTPCKMAALKLCLQNDAPKSIKWFV